MKDAIAKYRNRRDARLGIDTIKHYDSIEEYRRRRAERLKKSRMDAEDEGEWRTTDNGHKILIKDGAVVGGNPFALASMGAPKGKELPKTVKLSSEDRIGKFIRSTERDQVAEALSNHDGKCVFGGFYKVKTEEESATFFNPYTGEEFGVNTKVDHAGPWGMERIEDKLSGVVEKIQENEDVSKLYNRSHGYVQKGDTIRVVAGRTLEHGTEAKVRGVYDGKFGKYLYLDNGEKIQAKNVSIVDEDGSLVRSSEGKGHEELKAAHKEYREKRKEEEKAKGPDISESGVRSAIKSATSKKQVMDALKKAGYKVKDFTDEETHGKTGFDYRIDSPDGGYIRIYKWKKEIKIQDWKPAPKEELLPDSEIKGTKYSVESFLRRHKDEKTIKFENLEDYEKYFYVIAKSASYFLGQGMESRKAWTRAIKNGDYWADKEYKGYGDKVDEADEAGAKVLQGIIDHFKK